MPEARLGIGERGCEFPLRLLWARGNVFSRRLADVACNGLGKPGSGY